MSGAVHKLDGNQMRAVAPEETVWLSASAGTGKTHVLTSRVLRLLLQPGTDPSSVLCLTFTKAGATEMASRIRAVLAEWVRLPDLDLFARLDAIGAPVDEAAKARARTLFAAVLDCPGGGLRIDTIHAFSQWLLAAFPHEAGMLPGTRPMEDRERALLARQVLADLLVHAERDPLGDPQLLDSLADLSLRMGPDAVEGYLLRCAEARDVWFGPRGWQSADMSSHVLRLLGLPADAAADDLAAMCADDAFDLASLQRCREINLLWGTKKGMEAAGQISAWIACENSERAESIDQLSSVFLTQKGELRSSASQEKIDPAYADYVSRVCTCIEAIRQRKALLDLAARLVPALRLGRAFAIAWDEAKQREGLIDFDDQIREAARLLNRSDKADWIRYKLDRRFDHILVDEAQDTNSRQWDIIKALTGDYFAGLGQHDDLMRTLFVVGDYKQAIFRFQGTSPENFARARDWFAGILDAAAANAARQRSNLPARGLREYGLGRSFRTSQPVLDFVDAALEAIGHEAFGLDRPAEQHKGWDRRGQVTLWLPVRPGAGDEESEDEPDDGGQTWLSRPDRQMADRIAAQVAAWLDPAGEGFYLAKEKRRATPGDIMVLVRARRELAGLIVARLHAHEVSVAGVDRLRIGDPLAVRDLVSALRFAVQPLDDLNLAALLVSPLIGWSQEDLLRFGYRERGVRLWQHLRAAADPGALPAMEMLLKLLGRADFETPQQLLTWLLAGPWDGRRKLVARLGHEANDPIDELVNAAFAYCGIATPSLVGFLHWFDAGEGELKRESDNAAGHVRVMTVHGSKGLQAPIVILADATANPDNRRLRAFAMPDPDDPGGRTIPMPDLRKEERTGPIAARHEAELAAEREEHWRLLYVAMTRAEEALFVGGALTVRDKGEPHPDSWYARLGAMFPEGTERADPIWGGRLEWGDPPMGAGTGAISVELPLGEVLPPWLTRPPAAELHPPKPLAPSSLGEDLGADPPSPSGAGAMAARRGTIMHRLLERLPDVAGSEREAAGMAWLDRNAADLSADARTEMLRSSLAVLAEPGWAELFAPGSLAEVPVVATIGARAIAGAIDRLLVLPDRVLVVDYKTARRPPETLENVSRPILRQMAAYVAALEKIWPERQIEAALLYTSAPRMIALPPDLIEQHKRALTEEE